MITRSTLSSFGVGLVLGLSMMFILEQNEYMYYLHQYVGPGISATSQQFIDSKGIHRNTNNPKIKMDNLVKSSNTSEASTLGDTTNPEATASSHVLKPSSTTLGEAKRTRILCWIMTSPAYLSDRAKSVKETWGKRCDILLFMSGKADPNFPVIKLDVEEGFEKLWYKTRAALDYIYQHHLNDAEWFVKADDDTYMIIENLRHMLSKLNTSQPHYIGRYITSPEGYNSGGAGYVFSRETLRRFKKALGEASCPQHHKYEDVAVGVCLKAQGVLPVSTRDSNGRETFIPIPLEIHLTSGYVGDESTWLKQVNYPLPYKDGPESCSDYPISFHYVKPAMMYRMEYMIYRVKVRP